jgi:cytochrome c oxidase cbb3-type subunit 3
MKTNTFGKLAAATLLVLLAAAASAEELQNPLRGDATAAGKGEALYYAMNCDGCHAAAGFGFVGPSLADGRWRFGGSDEAVFRSIRDGRAQGMPAFGRMLADETIWQLVTYLQTQPVHVDVPTTAWP